MYLACMVLVENMASSQVEELLKQHPSLVLDDGRLRVKCSLTKHEMPVTVEAIQTFVNGKKYKKVAAMANLELDKHKQHILPSNKKNHLHEMFCTLTLRHIEKTPQAIQRHIRGRKYTNALTRWLKCQETGEKFVPHVRRKGKLPRSYKADGGRGEGSFFDSDDDQRDEDSDNMSDLYPDEDLKDLDDNDDDVEEDEDEEEEEKNEKPNPKKSKKHTKEKATGKNRQQPSKHEEDSGSDYDMGVLEVAVRSHTEPLIAATGTSTKPKRHDRGLAEPNGVDVHFYHNSNPTEKRLKKKRKLVEACGDGSLSNSSTVNQEKKMKKKKTREKE